MEKIYRKRDIEREEGVCVCVCKMQGGELAISGQVMGVVLTQPEKYSLITRGGAICRRGVDQRMGTVVRGGTDGIV